MIKRYFMELLSFVKASVLASFVYVIFGRSISPYVIHVLSCVVFVVYGMWDRFWSLDVRFGVFGNFLLFFMPMYGVYIALSAYGYNKLPAELFNYAFYPLRAFEVIENVNTDLSMVYTHVTFVCVAFLVIFVSWILKSRWMAKQMAEDDEYRVSDEMIEYVNRTRGEQYKNN